MESNVDLNLLKTFIITCELQNLKLVGLRLGISESAVSKQLSRLTEQLGQPLFIRTSAGLKPTQFAISVRPQLQESLKSISRILRKQTFDQSEYAQPIRIAMFEHFMHKHAGALFSKLRATFPRAPIEMETWSNKTTEKLLNGQLDIAIHFYNEDRTADIWQRTLFDDMAVGVVSQKYAGLSWDNLVTWPAIRLRSQGWNHRRFRYADMLKQNGIDLDIVATLDNIEAIHQIVNQQKVFAIINRSCVPGDLAVVIPPEELKYAFKIATNVHIVNRDAPLQVCLHQIINQVAVK
ncbi:LysR family transcriptional regulator [Vibrio ichthyoenteri ATCC 700023]|uniref:LysR family transcriptional regulator n=1 Tax=Vibrio ichthyoenteri ATCC 700023 TaxID=870968 RepID=F9S844_9VIBR|nr:LysR family transcriptional regulator [Vibrio ichthyoenteri]EGU30521.1 LysR family transcriptional regulator [Vibrio ichthyoenteri ATCC 700023]